MAGKNLQKDFKVLIAGDAKQLNGTLTEAGGQFARFGNKVESFAKGFDKVGRSVRRNLVLPLAAVAGASIKLAVDFETSMQKMVSLVGLPQAQVESFKDSIKDLSVETGRSAKELADAMFFITSAGIRGGASGDPLAVLSSAAKAAAAGMGETKVVADALTSAVNAYGVESLSAAEATDVLVATIREGKLEADQVSQVIGKVIPIAAELGVEFREVGAAIATMSRIGIDADVGSTALRASLSVLLKPTAEARDALASIGITTDDLRDKLANDGLLPMLTFLSQAFDGNTEAMGKVFGNVRSLTGVLGILSDNAKQADFIFNSLADNAGDTNRAFEAMTETTGFKLSQALASLQVAGIELGDELTPIVQTLAEGVQGLTEAFSDLDDKTKEGLGSTLLWTLGIGAAIVMLGSLSRAIVGIIGLLKAGAGAWAAWTGLAAAGAGAGVSATGVSYIGGGAALGGFGTAAATGTAFGVGAGLLAGGALLGAGYGGERNPLWDMNPLQRKEFADEADIDLRDYGYSQARTTGGHMRDPWQSGAAYSNDRLTTSSHEVERLAAAWFTVGVAHRDFTDSTEPITRALGLVRTEADLARIAIEGYATAVFETMAAKASPLVAAQQAVDRYAEVVKETAPGGVTPAEQRELYEAQVARDLALAGLGGSAIDEIQNYAGALGVTTDVLAEAFPDIIGALATFTAFLDEDPNAMVPAGIRARSGYGDPEMIGGQTTNYNTSVYVTESYYDPAAARRIVREIAWAQEQYNRETAGRGPGGIGLG